MGVELVTGYSGDGEGARHVSSTDDARRQAGTVGPGRYVLETAARLAASMEDANTLVMGAGDGMINGRHFTCPDSTSFTIPTGVQGMKVANLACVRYTRAADGKEAVTPVVLTGEPSADDPQDPAYNDGDILEGAATADFPLWRVVTDGIVPGEPEQLFQTVAPLADAQPETGEDGGWTWRKWPDGTAECWGRFTTTQTNYQPISGDDIWTYSTSFGGAAAPYTVPFPASLFFETPTVEASAMTNRYAIAVPSSDTTAAVYKVGLAAAGVVSSNVIFNLRAVGRWR